MKSYSLLAILLWFSNSIQAMDKKLITHTPNHPTAIKHKSLQQNSNLITLHESVSDDREELLLSQLREQLDMMIETYYVAADNCWENDYEFRKVLKKQAQIVQKMFNLNYKEAEKFILNLPSNNDGETLLHLAAHNHDAYLMNFLLKKGADVLAKKTDGASIFDIAHQRLRDKKRRQFTNNYP